MYSTKILLAAAALAVSGLASTANAAPWDNRFGDHRDGDRFDHRGQVMRHEVHRPYVERLRVSEPAGFHNSPGIGDPYFVRGHYVVRTINPFGRIVFVEVDPYSGAFLGEFRI